MATTDLAKHGDVAASDLKSKTQQIKDAFWEIEIGSKVGSGLRDLLQQYSGIPADKIEEHLYTVRDDVFQKAPYPCVAAFLFLQIPVREHPHYSKLRAEAKAEPPGSFRICDVGCGVAQDLRCLTYDGVPSADIVAIDLGDQMWQGGFEMFKDKETGMKDAQFIDASIFGMRDASQHGAAELLQLKGSVNVVLLGHMLHIFDWPNQLEACKCVLMLLREKGAANTSIMGWQGGAGGEDFTSPMSKSKLFMHSLESFRELWKTVGEQTNIELEVEVWRTPVENFALSGKVLALPEDFFFLYWAVRPKL